jgi:hypothetical protein
MLVAAELALMLSKRLGGLGKQPNKVYLRRNGKWVSFFYAGEVSIRIV